MVGMPVGKLAIKAFAGFSVQALAVLLVPAIAQEIERQMTRDPEQPGRKFGGRLVALARSVHAQKDFLSQFLRNRLVLDHAIYEVDYGLTVALHKQAVGMRIPVSHLAHQLNVQLHGVRRHARLCGHSPIPTNTNAWIFRRFT